MGDYSEELVELVTRIVHDQDCGPWCRESPTTWPPTYFATARAILDALSSAGRLLPPGAKTEWGCATPSEIRKQDPARWSTREAAEEHGNCGSCVIVSRLVTPWSVPDTEPEKP